MLRRLLTIAAIFPLAACATAPTPAAKAQEVATELAVNMRFGRMEMAIEKVAAKERDEWLKRHKSWGGKIRIADAELAGVKANENEAEVMLRVAWYKVDEQELRVTTVKQKFKDISGEWQLVGETRADGDVGLLGEPAPPPSAMSDEAPKPVHKPVIRIGADDE